MTAVCQGHYQDKFCRVRSDVSKGLQEANFLQRFLRTGSVNGVKCLGEVHSTTHVAILSICHWLPVEEYQVSSFTASQEPHWLSRKARLPLIWMSSSWKMTQVNAVLELCTSNMAPDCLSLHRRPYVGGTHDYYLFEIGTIKGCHPCLSFWPPYLRTVEETASLEGSVHNEWAEGENLSSKNQKRPHGFKYFQVARNSFLDSIFWNSLNHTWNLIHIKKIKGRELWLTPNCKGLWSTCIEHSNSRDHEPKSSVQCLLFLIADTIALEGSKVLSSKWMLSRICTCLRSHSNSWAKMRLEPGFPDSQPVLFILWVALSNAHKDWAFCVCPWDSHGVKGGDYWPYCPRIMTMPEPQLQGTFVGIRRKGFIAPQSSHHWKQGITRNSLNSS